MDDDAIGRLLVNEDLPCLDICGLTAGLVLAIGTLREIVEKQPGNDTAKRSLDDAEAKLKDHLARCEKCQNALGDSN